MSVSIHVVRINAKKHASDSAQLSIKVKYRYSSKNMNFIVTSDRHIQDL